MTQLEILLYFSIPVPSLRDVRIALMLDREYGQRDGVLEIIKTQSKIFDDFTRVFPILKEYYGQKNETQKNGQTFTKVAWPPKEKAFQTGPAQEKTPAQALKAALAREKALKGATFQDKEKIRKVEKIFQGRVL